jgi:hypothetical protein
MGGGWRFGFRGGPLGRMGFLQACPQSSYCDRVPDLQVELFGGIASVDGDFQETAGADYGNGLSRSGFLIESSHFNSFVIEADGDLVRRDITQVRECNICESVAEAVEINNLAADFSYLDLGSEHFKPLKIVEFRPELSESDAVAQMGCDRGEDVASMEGGADRVPEKLGIFESADGFDFFT